MICSALSLQKEDDHRHVRLSIFQVGAEPVVRRERRLPMRSQTVNYGPACSMGASALRCVCPMSSVWCVGGACGVCGRVWCVGGGWGVCGRVWCVWGGWGVCGRV